jgi:tetratricopeptide (TPR) repeat protein
VEQAASWLSTTAMSARSYLDLLDEQLPRILNEPPPPGYRHPAAETWRLSQERLRSSNPAAARLAEICAFLAPEPIPTTLLDNPATIAILAGVNPQYKDQLLRGSLVREISRYGLARVDPATNALRMHRLVQSVLRSDLPVHDQTAMERYVHEILAAEKRGDPADSESWPTYQGFLPHLEPSKALESDDTDVHQLTLDMVRYLRYRGDLAGAQGLAERATDAWGRVLGTDSVPVLRMRTELGNVLNAGGEYEQALEVLQDVADEMSANDALGEGHPYTLVAIGGVASALRGLGQYQRARDLDEVSVVRWQAAMGDDHQRTFMARNNLAISLRAVGDFQGAIQQDQELARRREKTLGRSHRQTLNSRINLGRDQRELGDLQLSEDTLQQTVNDYRGIGLGEGHPETAKAVRNLAITLRRRGRATDSLELIEPAQSRTVESLGAAHPNTLELTLEVARAKSTLGDNEAALAIAGPVVAAYRDGLGASHPVTLAAVNDFAVFHLRLGDHATALPMLEDAALRLADTLGADHPNTLVCQMNLANAKFAAGDIGPANQIDENCHKRLRARFTDTHPAVLVAAANLALSMIATGADDAGRALQRETARRAADKLGADHPTVVSIRDNVRISSHIDPPDV